jgi:single-strand DNA-binding protein
MDREGERAETVPVVWFDPPAAATALDIDDTVVVVGRVRRRFFRSGGSTQSRTEVVADRVVPARQLKRVRAALADAVSRLEELAGDAVA